MIKVLFLIHDLGQGGAEKVLVNLVNNMNRSKFDITVMSLFGGGVNEQFLKEDIRYITIFPNTWPGNSHVMKFFSPRFLHNCFVKEKYDIEVSYLEGPTARIVSGCQHKDVKLVSWIHSKQFSKNNLAASFRNVNEALRCYEKLDRIICVSRDIQEDLLQILGQETRCEVLYNTIETSSIVNKAREKTDEIIDKNYNIIAVGTLKEVKGYDRLLAACKKLNDNNYNFHLYILGKGPLQKQLEKYILENNLTNKVSFLGYQDNPYKFISKCNLFVCSSYSEGFSTATTEALIIGIPICTVDVGGMKELLGENNEYGLIVPNTVAGIYSGIKTFLDEQNLNIFYRKQSLIRGKDFSTETTVAEVEKMLEKLLINNEQL